jgi:hypothetical protein
MGYELATIYADVMEPGKGRKAIKIRKGNQSWWLPKSMIRKFERMSGNNYRIVVPRWLADQKGITEYFAS